MKRGEVRWYKLQHPDKKRPILILSRNSAIEFLGEVTIAPITSTIRHIDSEVILTMREGMKNDCAVNLDHIQTVAKAKIGTLITYLSEEKMQQVIKALLFALGE
ncbi:type II toxin-antitoxin system toxin endoribonuclease MazF3 [soil metagenome]